MPTPGDFDRKLMFLLFRNALDKPIWNVRFVFTGSDGRQVGIRLTTSFDRIEPDRLIEFRADKLGIVPVKYYFEYESSSGKIRSFVHEPYLSNHYFRMIYLVSVGKDNEDPSVISGWYETRSLSGVGASFGPVTFLKSRESERFAVSDASATADRISDITVGVNVYTNGLSIEGAELWALDSLSYTEYSKLNGKFDDSFLNYRDIKKKFHQLSITWVVDGKEDTKIFTYDRYYAAISLWFYSDTGSITGVSVADPFVYYP